MAADLTALSDAITNTLSPDPARRRAAEAFLDTHAGAVALLQLVARTDVPTPVRQGAAVYMKNYCIHLYGSTEWEKDGGEERGQVKEAIVGILLAVPLVVRRQLSEVLAIIAEHEYPTAWPALVPELGARLAAVIQAVEATKAAGGDTCAAIDWIMLQGVLETLNAVFERYIERSRSNELYTEINYSLEHTQVHLNKLLTIVCDVIYANVVARDANIVKLVFGNAELICKVLYCLSWQELPAYFEDHMAEFMTELKRLLVFDNAVIDAASEDEPSCIDTVHTSVLEIANLYDTKYDENLRPFLQVFVQDAWQLLVRRSNAAKYDGVVTTGIKFLTTVSRSPDYALFSDPAALSQVCKSIVIPNVHLREEDIEMFEDNPVEYVRRDMEGSDSGTRRRGAVELVKGLCTHFEQPVTDVFSSYVTEMLAPQSSWENRDTALYIVTALGWKSGTAAGGATETSSLINVVEFFGNIIAPELNRAGDSATTLETPIFTADIIKFAISFRNQIPKEACGNVILQCVKLLSAKEPVVKTYAAACIERLLTVKDTIPVVNGNGATVNGPSAPVQKLSVPRMSQADMQPLLEPLLPAIVQALQSSSRADEYVMRLVLRFCSVAKEAMGPYAENLLSALVQILNVVIKNPANPLFNHYLFEAISALIRFNGTAQTVTMFENALMTPLHSILTQDVTEFGPYVFQVMSQLMSVHAAALPPTYAQLVGPLMDPSMWDRRGYIPGMVQYLETYIRKNGAAVVSANQLEPILGIFRKLIALKSTDHLGLRMLCTIFESYDVAVLSQYINPIFNVLMVRLNAAKTAKFVSSLLYCLSVFVVRFGAGSIKAAFDSVQPNLLDMLLRQVWLPDVVTIRKPAERRVCALALADLACATELCTTEPYATHWAKILTVTVALTEGVVMDQADNDDVDDREAAEAHLGGGESYSAAHSQLRWGAVDANRAPLFATNIEPRAYLAEKVASFTARHPGQFSPIIQTQMEAGARDALLSYMTASGREIS